MSYKLSKYKVVPVTQLNRNSVSLSCFLTHKICGKLTNLKRKSNIFEYAQFKIQISSTSTFRKGSFHSLSPHLEKTWKHPFQLPNYTSTMSLLHIKTLVI